MALLAAPAVSFVGMIRFRFEGSSGRVVPQSQSSAEDTPTGTRTKRRDSRQGKQNLRLRDVVDLDERVARGAVAAFHLQRVTAGREREEKSGVAAVLGG